MELESVLKVDLNEKSLENQVNNIDDKKDLHLTLLNKKIMFDENSESRHYRFNFRNDVPYDVNHPKNDEKNFDVKTEVSHDNTDSSDLNSKFLKDISFNFNQSKSDIPYDFGTNSDGVDKNIEVRSTTTDINKDLSLSSSKRLRSDSEDSDIMNKKYRGIIKQVSIVPENSDDKISIDLVKQVQTAISTAIDEASFLPLLQCHGIKNDELVYGCHSEKSYRWLIDIISVASELKVKVMDIKFADEDYHKMKLKVNSFIEEKFNKFLNRIELYNAGLVTDKWKLISRQIFRNCIVMTLWVDRHSYEYICDSNFALFAGVDKVQFCSFWVDDAVSFD